MTAIKKRPDEERRLRKVGSAGSRYALPIALPVCSTITGAIAAVNSGPHRVYWSIGTVAAVLISAVMNVAKDRSAAQARTKAARTRTEVATTLADTARPVVAALANLSATDSVDAAERELAVLMNIAVSLARSEVGLQTHTKCTVRAAFYALDGKKLIRKNYRIGAKANPARPEFVTGRSKHDDNVIEFAKGESALLIENLDEDAPPHFADRDSRSYKSFISVPVRIETKSYGLLTADSSVAYTLTSVDVGYLILLAGMLAAGLAHLEALESRP